MSKPHWCLKNQNVIIVHIGSTGITNANYDNVITEDFAQRIFMRKNVDRLVLTTLQFCPFY